MGALHEGIMMDVGMTRPKEACYCCLLFDVGVLMLL